MDKSKCIWRAFALANQYETLLLAPKIDAIDQD